MKKFIVFFCAFWIIFIILIFNSSQCWATTSTIDSVTIDTTQYPIATIEDFVNILLVNEDLYKEYFTFDEMFESYYLIGASFNDSVFNDLQSKSNIFLMPFLQSNIYTCPKLSYGDSGRCVFTKDLTATPIVLDNSPYYYLYYSYNTTTNVATLYFQSTTNQVNNAVYSHRSWLDGYLWSNANNVYYVTNYGQPTNNRTTLVTQGQVELPEEEEEEQGILDTLKHLFIPNEEDLQGVRNNFTNNISSRFSISAWAFDSSSIDREDVSYYSYSAPYWTFTIFGAPCKLDTQEFFDLIDMPISLGFRNVSFAEWDTFYVEQNSTNGLTIRSFINILLTLELFILNIYLYNKFFAKGE